MRPSAFVAPVAVALDSQPPAAPIDEGVPAHVLSAALFDRFESRGEAEFANRLLSAMRKEFGGHDEQKPA